jgi:hypothetical protein
MALIIQKAISDFKVQDEIQNSRFYYFKQDGSESVTDRFAGKQTIRTPEQWEQFMSSDECLDHSALTLYFVTDPISPANSAPLTPEPVPEFPGERSRSEASVNTAVLNRDEQVCIICGEDKPQVAHIIDASRPELAQALALDHVDSAANCVSMCPNHHTAYDRNEFVLVPCGNNKFRISRSPHVEPTRCVRVHLNRIITIQEPCPPAHLFLARTLRRFDVKCQICTDGLLYKGAAGLSTHHGKMHKEQILVQPLHLMYDTASPLSVTNSPPVTFSSHCDSPHCDGEH